LLPVFQRRFYIPKIYRLGIKVAAVVVVTLFAGLNAVAMFNSY